MSDRQLNTIELFAGCGGLLDGFKQTNIYNTIACVEWEKKQCEVLKKRLENKYGYKNADEIVINFDIQRTEELLNGWRDEKYSTGVGLNNIVGNRKIDIISGGPPCQAYSIAGRIKDKDGMRNDYRNYLFESYIRIVSQYEPKLFVFENVEGILSAKPGSINIIDEITKEFEDANYTIVKDIRKNALIDFSEYGVPQKRKRVIIIGLNNQYFKNPDKLLEKFYNYILPKYKSDKTFTVKDAIYDLPSFTISDEEYKIENKRYSHIPHSTNIPQHEPRFHNKRDINIFKILAKDISTGENKYTSTLALQKLYTEMTGKKSNIHKYHVLRWDKPSNTIPAHLKKDGLRHIHPDYKQARTITVREAARLQTFSDDFIFSDSASKNYEMIGNAVPPTFAYKLGLAIDDMLKEEGY